MIKKLLLLGLAIYAIYVVTSMVRRHSAKGSTETWWAAFVNTSGLWYLIGPSNDTRKA